MNCTLIIPVAAYKAAAQPGWEESFKPAAVLTKSGYLQEKTEIVNCIPGCICVTFYCCYFIPVKAVLWSCDNPSLAKGQRGEPALLGRQTVLRSQLNAEGRTQQNSYPRAVTAFVSTLKAPPSQEKIGCGQGADSSG